MAKKKHKSGSVEIELTEGLTIPDQAKTLTAEEKKRLPKPWKTLNSAARDTAATMKAHPGKLRMGPDEDADAIQRLTERSEAWNPLIAELRAMLALVENANALDDAALHSLLLKCRRQLQAQLKDEPELATLFAALLNYAAR